MAKPIGIARGMQGTGTGYLAVVRLVHSTKHIFIVRGVILAYIRRGIHTKCIVSSVTVGLMAAMCIASASVINEWFDREFDRFHQTKSQRAADLKTFHDPLFDPFMQ